MSGNVRAATRGQGPGRGAISTKSSSTFVAGSGVTTAAGAPPPATQQSAAAAADGVSTSTEGGPTDAIIEELKALAKSMLDATNAARRRANTLESRRSYEALMNAIEGRGGVASVLSVDAATAAAGDIRARGGNSQTMSTASSLPSLSNAPPAAAARHADPTAGVETCVKVESHTTTAAAAEEDLIDVPASLGPSWTEPTQLPTSSSARAPGKAMKTKSANNAAAGEEAAAARKTKVTASAERDGSTAVEDGGSLEEPHLHAAAQHESSDASPGSAAAEEEEDNVFDGVKTQVFFKSTDAAAYHDVASSAWKPEQLLRSADGTTIPDESDEDDDSSGRDSSSSSSRKRAGSDDDDVPVASLGTRNRVVVAKKPKRVYRVPLFPYGGGVTEAEAKELSKKFMQCIRGSSRSSAAANAIPKFVSKEAFVGGDYEEIAPVADGRHAAFKPQSPYEFVVEVERSVLFDAVAAGERRRREFREQVKKGKAPVTMGTFNLRIIMDPTKTGFEDEKQFPIVRGNVVADRYQIVQLLGKATFSRAVRCYDLHQPIYDEEDDEADEGEGARRKKERKPIGYVEVCLKIINNTKDFFDQSLDEIRLLTLINTHKDPDEAHVVRLIDAFYYKEHTMLVTELLSDNLYEYSKYNREEEEEFYFTLPRLRRIARQIAEALSFVHSLNLIHADLKPENVLFVSHRRCIVKVIDFGSSCFLSDHLSSYIQSRSYRAPEVVLGCDYDGRIDVWSLGAILVELVTGDVLFTSETVPEMLARICYVCGQPFPRRMLWEGRHTCSFINKFGLIYESSKEPSASGDTAKASPDDTGAEEPYYVYTPVPGYVAPTEHADKSSKTGPSRKPARGSREEEKEEPFSVLRHKLAAAGQADEQFFSFVKACLTLDHKRRPTSAELLSHPFIANEKV